MSVSKKLVGLYLCRRFQASTSVLCKLLLCYLVFVVKNLNNISFLLTTVREVYRRKHCHSYILFILSIVIPMSLRISQVQIIGCMNVSAVCATEVFGLLLFWWGRNIHKINNGRGISTCFYVNWKYLSTHP